MPIRRKVIQTTAAPAAPPKPDSEPYRGDVHDRDGKLLLIGDPVRIARRTGLQGLGELPAFTAEITGFVFQKGRVVLHLRAPDEEGRAFRAALPEQARRIRRGEAHFAEEAA